MKTETAVAALSALAHPTRLDVVRRLVSHGTEGEAAGSIADHLGLGASALSFHLAALSEAGLISSQRQARSLIYRAEFSALGDLVGYLLHDCCAGDQRVRACC